MSLLKHLSTMLSTPGNPQLHTDLFKKIVHALLVCPSSHRVEPSDAPSPQKKARRDGGAAQGALLVPDVHAHFLDTWLSVHDDVRWFFLREAACVPFTQSPALFSPSLTLRAQDAPCCAPTYNAPAHRDKFARAA
jgi:U3 small nucleolar RNA-associated protein 19